MELEEVLKQHPDFKIDKKIGKFVILYNEETKKYGIYDLKFKGAKGNFAFDRVFELTTKKIIICQNCDGKYFVYGNGVPSNKKVDEFVANEGNSIILGNDGFYIIYDTDFKKVSVPFKFSSETISFIKQFFSLSKEKRSEYLRTHSISMEVASILYLVEKNDEAYDIYNSKNSYTSYGKRINSYYNNLENNMYKYCKLIKPAVSFERFKKELIAMGKGLADDLSYVY